MCCCILEYKLQIKHDINTYCASRAVRHCALMLSELHSFYCRRPDSRNLGSPRCSGKVNIEDFGLKPSLKASPVNSMRNHCATNPRVVAVCCATVILLRSGKILPRPDSVIEPVSIPLNEFVSIAPISIACTFDAECLNLSPIYCGL